VFAKTFRETGVAAGSDRGAGGGDPVSTRCGGLARGSRPDRRSARGALAQLVERCLCKADVRSSNLLGSTDKHAGRMPGARTRAMLTRSAVTMLLWRCRIQRFSLSVPSAIDGANETTAVISHSVRRRSRSALAACSGGAPAANPRRHYRRYHDPGGSPQRQPTCPDDKGPDLDPTKSCPPTDLHNVISNAFRLVLRGEASIRATAACGGFSRSQDEHHRT
jgi:hypothetical protein